MVDYNIVIVSVIFGVIALFSLIGLPYKENFWNIPSRKWRREKVLGHVDGEGRPDYFQSPNFQALISPRFSNVNYGPHLRTKLPPYDMMAVPEDPLNKEEFRENYTRQGKNTDNDYTQSNYANGNYNDILGSIPRKKFTDTVEVGDGLMFGENGEMINPIVYDRFTVANRNSRLRAHGDKIRGDLPIAPHSGKWFQVNVHPDLDLEPGAMNVLGGVDNGTSRKLAGLIYKSSGNTETHIGGVDMSDVNITNRAENYTSGFGGDITVTSFP